MTAHPSRLFTAAQPEQFIRFPEVDERSLSRRLCCLNRSGIG
jgi:hypothetical protein